jgi:hypothetical protein
MTPALDLQLFSDLVLRAAPAILAVVALFVGAWLFVFRAP